MALLLLEQICHSILFSGYVSTQYLLQNHDFPPMPFYLPAGRQILRDP